MKNQEEFNEIVDSYINGQFSQAQEQIEDYGVKAFIYDVLQEQDSQDLSNDTGSDLIRIAIQSIKYQEPLQRALSTRVLDNANLAEAHTQQSGVSIMYSAYDFSLGAIDRREENEDNAVSISKDHKTYKVQGFINGRHVSQTTDKLADAYRIRTQLFNTAH